MCMLRHSDCDILTVATDDCLDIFTLTNAKIIPPMLLKIYHDQMMLQKIVCASAAHCLPKI